MVAFKGDKMNERTKISRPISAREVVVIRTALERAAAAPEFKQLTVKADRLHVVGKCDCGCDSVDFTERGKVPSKPLADGIGSTARGGKVGVIIWGTPEMITGLEIYDLGAGDHDRKLPTPESIASFEKSTP
jgi:hypothetical protein